jgi:peroxiredoxin
VFRTRVHPRIEIRRSRTTRTVGVLLICAAAAGLAWMLRDRAPARGRAPGQSIADFAIKDVRTGQLHRLSDHRGRVVAIIFTGTSCPVGDLYLPRLNAQAKAFESRGVDFLAINSNASESPEEVAEHARRSSMRFPVLKDQGNRVADQLLAERTCEALVIDRSGRLRYRGAIDDQYGLGARRDHPERNYLSEAIEALLAGRRVEPELTPVVGCPIERVVAVKPRPRITASAAAASPGEQSASKEGAAYAGSVTYAADVAPILHARCAGCHRPGQVAPFSLLTFEQARRWSTSIDEVIRDRRMPPWHADPRHGRFANDRGLTEQDRALLTAWVEQGSPPGDLGTAPKPAAHPHGWSIGTPDVIFELPETVTVRADGAMPILHIRVPTNLKQDVWFQAAEVRPSDRAVVHHIFVYSEVYDKEIRPQKEKVCLAAYLPGDAPTVYPPGVAKKIPAGSTLVFEIHYTPIGTVRIDRPSFGVIVAKHSPLHVAITRGIAERNLRIPARASDHIERADWTVKRDIHVLSLSPHMHLRGKSFAYEAHYPDGRKEVLLSVPHYDFNWQSVYQLLEPRALPKGTRIHCEAHFDNSTANPANPDPGQTVTWGEQSWDEMMMGYIDYYEDDRLPAGK